MADQSGDALVQRWADAWNSHDVDRIRALFTDDCTYEDVPSGGVWKGEEVRPLFELNFVLWGPDFRVEDVSGFTADNEGVIRWTMCGTRLGKLAGVVDNGDRYLSARGVSVFSLRDGRIEHNRDYWDGWLGVLRDGGHIRP